MRYWTNQIIDANGNSITTQIAWTENDYIQAIYDLESEITPRRIRESILTQSGAEWLEAKEAEIQALRDELNNL